MIKKYWYAVDKDGQSWYYDNLPIRDKDTWNIDHSYDDNSYGKLSPINDLHDPKYFNFPVPPDMTWEDEPIKFEIEI